MVDSRMSKAFLIAGRLPWEKRENGVGTRQKIWCKTRKK
jgi:hypothetical protein